MTLMRNGGLLLLALVLGGGVLAAASRGPDAGGYTATDAALYSFVDLSVASGAAGMLADTDDGSAALTLPFPFRFYGQTYAMVCVSSNGALYFVPDAEACTGAVDFANTDLTVAGPPGDRPALLPFWSDLSFQVPGAGAVLYQTTGTPGDRQFIVQWNNVYPVDSPNPVTFEVVLHEATNRVVFQYRTVNLGSGNTASKGALATIGIRNAGYGPISDQIQWSSNAPVVDNETALLFAPPGLITPTINWPAPAAIASGTALGPAQLNATVNAVGTLTYTPPAGTVLPPGNGQTLSVSFTPADPGSYAAATASTTIDVTNATLSAAVLAPAAGRMVFIGTPTLITWNASPGATRVDVDYARNGGSFEPIPACTNLAGTALNCLWTPTTPAAGSAQVRVRLTSGSGGVTAVSGVFSVNARKPNLNLTPAIKGPWTIGQAQTIRWNHNLGTGVPVRVELSRDNGATWTVLAAAVASQSVSHGELTWTVSGPATTSARIRVSGVDVPVSDTSGAFAIR